VVEAAAEESAGVVEAAAEVSAAIDDSSTGVVSARASVVMAASAMEDVDVGR